MEFACSSVGFFTLLSAFGSLAVDRDWHFWDKKKAILQEVSLITFMASACINPFFYLYNHREFKQYANLFFNRAKVGQARADFEEGRVARARLDDDAAIVREEVSQTAKVTGFMEDGNVKVFTAAKMQSDLDNMS